MTYDIPRHTACEWCGHGPSLFATPTRHNHSQLTHPHIPLRQQTRLTDCHFGGGGNRQRRPLQFAHWPGWCVLAFPLSSDCARDTDTGFDRLEGVWGRGRTFAETSRRAPLRIWRRWRRRKRPCRTKAEPTRQAIGPKLGTCWQPESWLSMETRHF
ncbi:hypothetical protein CDEST_11864 [Colletotrichum destructivum]|uniref:C2H2-type domain-containing protein n=1 Tax=Colletotrichum destructivum TaxID=34406 RepID=A0AAX4IUE3_9PEZI|nr:hypothetical protein CDEST_11864 [Colletotrichum destructivum]